MNKSILNKIEYEIIKKNADSLLPNSYGDEVIMVLFKFLGTPIYSVTFRERFFRDKMKMNMWIVSDKKDIGTKYLSIKNLDEVLLKGAKEIMKQKKYYTGG